MPIIIFLTEGHNLSPKTRNNQAYRASSWSHTAYQSYYYYFCNTNVL